MMEKTKGFIALYIKDINKVICVNYFNLEKSKCN